MDSPAVVNSVPPSLLIDELAALATDLRGSSMLVDGAITDLRGRAAAAREALQLIYSEDMTSFSPVRVLQLSELLDTVDRSEASKISLLESELLTIDAFLVSLIGFDESLRCDIPLSAQLTAELFAKVRKFVQRTSTYLQLSPPETDVTLEVVPCVPRTEESSMDATPLAFLMTEAPPIDVELTPGLIIPVTGETRRAMIVSFNPELDTADVIFEPPIESNAPRFVDVDLSATPRIAHTGSWSGCGGNPTGIAKCMGSGSCTGECVNCGAGTHWRCCGDPVKSSTQCTPGTTPEMSEHNTSLMYKKSSEIRRCDAIPGVHFAPAAYGTLITCQPCGPMRDAVRAAMTRAEIAAAKLAWVGRKARAGGVGVAAVSR